MGQTIEFIINQTVQNLVKVAVLFRFLSDAKTSMNVWFSEYKPINLFVSIYLRFNWPHDRTGVFLFSLQFVVFLEIIIFKINL